MEPFGVNVANEDPDGNAVNFEFPLRYPGQYFDKESNLGYNINRDYDSTLGRYVQADPVGVAWDVNLYAYVRAKPLSLADSMGLGPSDKTFGLPKEFWNWYHRQEKIPGDPDIDQKRAKELYDEWKSQGGPGPDKKGKHRSKGKGTARICIPLTIFDMLQEFCALNPGDPACLIAVPSDPNDPCKGDPFCI